MYIAPEMEILDSELAGGILAGSGVTMVEEQGYIGGPNNPNGARQYGGDFDDFDDFEEDDY